MKVKFALVAGLCLAILAGCTATPTSNGDAPRTTVSETGAQLFEGMGAWHRRFSTSSEEAQHYLVQGFVWLQSFNHDEAVRSFKQAALLDPRCAIAWWGVSFAEGPNYNDWFMNDRRNRASWDALQNALARIDNAARWERDLIRALAARYERPFPEDRSHLNRAYADAMGKVWERYPDDPDIGALYAEAMMVCRPWALYSIDREPVGDTELIVETLERVLQIDPNHPAACHLYIHAVEIGPNPELGVGAADRLSRLVPVSGHLLHMPSHIYTRVNQWDRSIGQNALAMEADDRYRERSPDQVIQHMYMIHNNHILAYSAMMVGREREAMEASRLMWSDFPRDRAREVAPWVDIWMCSLYDVQKRFGRWDDLLAEPAPPDYMPVTTAYWRAHRAIAHAAKRAFDAAEREYVEFEKLYENPPEANLLSPWEDEERYRMRLNVMRHFVPGEIALQRGDYDLAIEHLLKAVEAEDKLGFGGEPPDFLQPIRHTLGAVYLKAGQAEKAEPIYREDLDEFPGNGWSLYGLSRALEIQGKSKEAARVTRAFRFAWAKADEPLTTSCKCIPEL